MNSEQVIFEADGTRYDLVLCDDPYGGILVIWPDTGYLWRWHEGDRMKDLSRNVNDHDAINIFTFLERRAKSVMRLERQ